MSDIDGLPIIEVMEYPQVDGITPTVIIPEVSEDAISREWILSQGKYYYNGKGEQEYAIPIGTIKSAPSVIPQAKEGKWIPCSERLPKKDGSYLVCMSWDYLSMDVLMWADGWNCTRRINGEVNRESEMDEEIIAWMPLPKPWKGVDNE